MSDTDDLVAQAKALMVDRVERIAELDLALNAVLAELAERTTVVETARLVGLSLKNTDKRVQRHRARMRAEGKAT